MSANLLRDGSGVALVEPPKLSDSDEPIRRNAVILNGDGSQRARVDLPIPDHEVYWFNDMYYFGGELTAMLMIPGRDLAVVVDEQNGHVIRYYETR